MELAEIRGSVHRLDKIIDATVRRSIWQLIALIVTLLLAISGGLAYQTTAIDKRIEQLDRSSSTRFETIEKRIERSAEKTMTGRFEDFERNITARFEDLKQEVRTQRK
jgi:hypothetical protein